jgi:polyhydroxyalkanoate synthesis regulator phasin
LSTTEQLCEAIDQFLKHQVLSKSEEDRTKREQLLLETGRAFYDVLVRQAQANATPQEEPASYEQQMTEILRSYNEVNRLHDLADVDVKAMSAMRGNGRGR